MKTKRRLVYVAFFLALICMAYGCGNKKDYNDGKKYYTKKNESEATSEKKNTEIVNAYDICLTAVVKKIDTDIGIITIVDADSGKEHTLTCSKHLQVIDEYGQEKTASYISSGDLIYAYYVKDDMELSGVMYASEIWEIEGIEALQVDQQEEKITVGKTDYYYTVEELFVVSDEELVSVVDIGKQDQVSIRGIGKQVIAVSIEKGHGYVRLSGIEKFLGGWVQVGKVIKPITENMLLTVQEGTFDVKIAKDGYGGALSTTVIRNEETIVDFSDISAKIVQYGTVEFTIEPEEAEATLYVAGQKTNYNTPVLLEYDTYKIAVEAEGYESYSAKLKVGSTLSQITIELVEIESEDEDEDDEDEDKDEKDESDSDEDEDEEEATPTPVPTPVATPTAIVTATETPITSGIYTITITAPEGASVYFDDAYVGVAPVTFSKTSGTHTLTLSREGYETKSYTLDISNENSNATYCMPELIQSTQ